MLRVISAYCRYLFPGIALMVLFAIGLPIWYFYIMWTIRNGLQVISFVPFILAASLSEAVQMSALCTRKFGVQSHSAIACGMVGISNAGIGTRSKTCCICHKMAPTAHACPWGTSLDDICPTAFSCSEAPLCAPGFWSWDKLYKPGAYIPTYKIVIEFA